MKFLKNKISQILLFFLLPFVISCKKNDGDRSPISDDGTKPGVVTNVKVDNFKGGAYITYDLPKSDNILYVLAKYQIRDKVGRETKASFYSDTVTVDGFAKPQEYDVVLYTVSRSNVMSDPVTVKVNPDSAAYASVRGGVAMLADFGGVNIKSKNTAKEVVGIIVTVFNPSTQAMDIVDQHYTKDSIINYSIRGFNTNERKFGVYVTDKYGNVSDTLQALVKPLYEEQLDKTKFSTFTLPSDSKIGYGVWVVSNIWDGVTDGSKPGWHTEPGSTPPFLCTFGVGRTYKLSRFVFYERGDEYSFGHGNPKIFSLWGSNKLNPADATLPIHADEGTVIGDWINLGNFNYPPPPSGLPPLAANASDKAFVKAGVNFNIPISAPAVRFIRVCTEDTWSGGTIAHFMEITLFGQPQ